MKSPALLLRFQLAAALLLPAIAGDTQASSAADKAAAQAASLAAPPALVLAPTNRQALIEVLARKPGPLSVGPGQTNIAMLTSVILEDQHYVQRPFDDELSGKFFDRYLEMLDTLRLHFLQSDIAEFQNYRTNLDDLTKKLGDLSPAHQIYERFLERFTQRVEYVVELLATEPFEFTGTDRYNVDRRKAPRPKDLQEAKQLWRQHLRHEVLQEKLNKEKPEEIGRKITQRYSRLLRTLQDYDRDDVFEFYLSALAQAYDPHSDYMGKSALENFNINMRLSLFGIGALLTSEDGYCKIRSVVPNGPAARSKEIKENDRIIAVAQGTNDPVDVIEMKLNKVVELIRGPKDSEVRLTIIPADASDPSVRKVVSLIRDEIKLEDQEAKAKIIDFPGTEGKPVRVGLIDLPSFYAEFDLSNNRSDPELRKSTTRDVALLLRKLAAEQVKGIVLDLRRNGGGSLEEAINLTGLFIPKGPVVQVKDHDGRIFVDSDTDPAVLYDGPLVVLTSRFSASASEILAGALQDYGRAVIVGDSSTHGKGTVQQLIQLNRIGSLRSSTSNPGALKITIRKFYRASGASTQRNGVIPDIVLPSLNNHAEVGEASLDNSLAWDTIPATKFEPVNRVQAHLRELSRRSAARVESDPDFDYLREDIDQLKKALADRSVSLNEAQRLKEKAEAEERTKARQSERSARSRPEETVYELTLKLAAAEGLPEPVSHTNTVAKVEAPAEAPKTETEPEESEDNDSKSPPVDAFFKEAKRILVDLISLRSSEQELAAAEAKKTTPGSAPSSLSGAQERVVRE